MDFDSLLSELLALNGREVTVSAGGYGTDPALATICTGHLVEAADMNGKGPGAQHETFLFRLAEGGAFMVGRPHYRSARRRGANLEIVVGGVVLTVEPLD